MFPIWLTLETPAFPDFLLEAAGNAGRFLNAGLWRES